MKQNSEYPFVIHATLESGKSRTGWVFLSLGSNYLVNVSVRSEAVQLWVREI